MEKETILGVDVCVTEYDDLSKRIKEDIRDNKQSFIVAINPEKIIKANNDVQLMENLNKAEYQIPDGIGVVLASRLKKGKLRKRITGIDSMTMILASAVENQYKIFLFGAKPEVLDEAIVSVRNKYEGIQIVGSQDGYSDRSSLVQTINDSKAQILFVALGSPTQENWILDNRKNLDVNILQGVGGSFDVLSNRIKRAPKWMQRFGIEWLYRLLIDPKRILRQINLVYFLIDVIRDTPKD